MSSDPEKRIVFFTGAGISAECGLPTYRGPGGIWDEYDWESVACQRAFERDPQKVWDFQHRRRALYRDARPSRAHHMIRALQRKAPSRVAVITQNIDGLHQRAGTEDVLELHGNLWRVYCSDPSCDRHVAPWEIPGSSAAPWPRSSRSTPRTRRRVHWPTGTFGWARRKAWPSSGLNSQGAEVPGSQRRP